MKLLTSILRNRRQKDAWALLAVMTLAGVGLMLLASVMNWARENSGVTTRNNEYFTTSYAAEAATEKVLATMSQQYQDYGFSAVTANLTSYATTLPSSSDNSYWTNYQFSGGSTANQIIVANTATSNSIVLGAPYTGLTMVANTYEIIANAQNNSSMYGVVSTVGQKIYLGTIPLFQFAIFYQDTMEIAPGANMTITGTVHGNQNVYIDPGAQLTFTGNVSSTGNVVEGKNPLDPSVRTMGTITFDGFDLSDVDPLNLPVGTNTTGTVSNSSANVYAILQMPTAGQTPTDDVGKNLLYNQADLIIILSNNNTITVTSGADVNGQATVISNSQWANFISTNGSFYDQRDDLTVNPIVLNVSNLVNWSATNNSLRPVLSGLRGSSDADVQSIYVADLRSTSNQVVTTNVAYLTNWNTNTTYPTAGTYLPPVVTNTTSTSSSSKPAAGTYTGTVTTNTTSTSSGTYPTAGTYTGTVTTNGTSTTSSSHPSPGTYVGAVTTNTTSASSGSYPTAGTYTGSVTTNTTYTSSSSKPASGTYVGSYTQSGGKYYYYLISGYTYNEITGYTYDAISGYTYNLITSYTYNAISNYAYETKSTNTTVLTNWDIVSQPGIVLSNGAVLPPEGLSVASPDPAYIVGNWNIQTSASGSSDAGLADTTYTHPSALYADAITVLSSAWNPANSTASLSSRTANNDTVNSAFLTGNVPSNGSYYSGGVENFPRFLENWSGKTFTYNGSMVAMFPSQIANAPWPGTGTVYNPPTRTWAFDNNFNNPSKQPPLTPQIISVQRNQWVLLPPRTTQF